MFMVIDSAISKGGEAAIRAGKAEYPVGTLVIMSLWLIRSSQKDTESLAFSYQATKFQVPRRTLKKEI